MASISIVRLMDSMVMPDFDLWDEQRGNEIIYSHAQEEGAALVILHALQEAFGHVPRDSVPMVATALNLTRAELHGIVTFYHDFRETPPGAHVLKLCRAEACQSMGADALATEARRLLQIDWGETTPGGQVTLEPVFCLGLCACAPAAMLDGKLYGGLDGTRLAALLDRAQQP
jgi:formate dehydrogenase subunit gamma